MERSSAIELVTRNLIQRITASNFTVRGIETVTRRLSPLCVVGVGMEWDARSEVDGFCAGRPVLLIRV
jgi:hypothetical protein